MKTRLDIYGNRAGVYNQELETLRKWGSSEKNRELLIRWHNHLFATGSAQLRVAKLSTQLRKIALHLGKDLDKVTMPDIEGLMAKYRLEAHWSEATKADYRRALKQFYKWFQEEDQRLETLEEAPRREALKFYKYLKDHVGIAYERLKVDYSAIITEEDLRLVLDKGCATIKERAFLAVLHEGGFRAGEILNVHLMDLEIKDDQIVIQVDGKTGRRRVPLFLSMAHLLHWLDFHPQRGDPQAFLWVGDCPNKKGEPLMHGGTQKMVNRCFQRAGLARKQHNLHWFRHSRASLMAPHMTEPMLCEYFGWVMGSRQVRTYCHADVSQVQDAICRMRGLKKAEEQNQAATKCHACSLVNEKGRRFCGRCGRALTTEAAMEEKDALEMAFKLLGDIMTDPKRRESFEQWQKAHKGDVQ